MDRHILTGQRIERARRIAQAGGLEPALADGSLPRYIDTTLSEALVLGLLRQGVRKYIGILGHGSTEIGEVLRIYEAQGLVKTYAVRSEVEAGHAAMALRWVTGEKAAVVTSIGPGALHAFASSLAAASDGVGVWYLFGDETTEDEGPNMQQIPKHEQGLFHQMCATLGEAYSLHTPAALGPALQRGLCRVDDPHFAGPFFLLLPLNTQPAPLVHFNLDELPAGRPPRLGPAADEAAYREAVAALTAAERVTVKLGGGARAAGPEIQELLELTDAVAVLNPIATGTIPYDHPRNMLVGGSKGSICGNHAMEEADLIVAVGTRAVCQSDSSRTGYPRAAKVINLNTDPRAALHYTRTVALVGDAAATLRRLNELLRAAGRPAKKSKWLEACAAKRREWEAFKQERFDRPALLDEMWQAEVLTQPAAIKIATDWARAHDAVTFFDAGDVQANGFQIVEDDRIGRTFTETGASYMGFAVSALLSTALADRSFYGLALSGDGSFVMNPQILLDGVEHGARGCILLLDNRRMAAISSLQLAQYGKDYATNDAVRVDYRQWAAAIQGVLALDGGRTPESLRAALAEAYAHPGLSLIHLPVYFGPDPLGGLGAFGRWNVGNWVENVQALRHKIGL
ncbi:MAG: thiamine pyrophosphate-binding protein [Myxococcales bacterium]|nr:thiamine pyrophosphate-binding protein [Myxococcales bacterium]